VATPPAVVLAVVGNEGWKLEEDTGYKSGLWANPGGLFEYREPASVISFGYKARSAGASDEKLNALPGTID